MAKDPADHTKGSLVGEITTVLRRHILMATCHHTFRGFKKTPLALAISTLLMTTSGQVSADAASEFYRSGNYTYCDVRLLSAYWGHSPWDAKVRAGNKLLANEQYVVEDYLRSARNYGLEHNVTCSFADADNPSYSYQDAEKLARYWGHPTPYDAKLKIGTMLWQGENKAIQQALYYANQGG